MQETTENRIENLVNAGFNYHQKGELDDAEHFYMEALSLNPDNAEVNNLIGVLYLQKNDADKSIEYVLKAVKAAPSEYFYQTLFQAYIRKGDYDSIISYEKIINDSYPNVFELLFDLAYSYKCLKKHKEALKYYEKALHINPMSYEGWSNVANIYSIEARTADAVSAMEVCFALRPNDDDTAYYMALDYFRTKNYAKGLPLFEKRISKKVAFVSQNKTLPQKVREDNFWNGEKIKDKNILIYYEAGFGDALMYARYLPLVAKKCKKLTFMCHKGLTQLFEQNKKHLGIDELIDSFDPNSDIDIDVHASLLSLPYLLGLKGEKVFESPEGYIVPDMKMVENYHKKYFDNDKIKVGIKWQGNTFFDKDRVIPAEMFNQLIDLDNAQYYSFQTFEGSDNVSKIHNIIDIGKDLTDFSQTAAALRNLDLVICNDTSLAHLAGAMRIPCWVMLPYEVNWRWHTDLSKCDWYESVRLFRQKAIGDWQSVFDQIKEEMKSN